MDRRHADLSAFAAAMENSGHPNSQQLRPPSYGDLCRPPGTLADPASTLSYHSRYLASLPLSTGSSFPFLNSMFAAGTLSAAPTTTSFRAPSAPGMSSMRQFWPPTPPPDGYGRYGLSASLFPLFGSVSPSPPDSGTYMTQGLVSRLSTSGHLPHLIDNHKDPGFFSPGFSLSSPLTPSSHVTSTAPFSHMSPSVEKHTNYGHIAMTAKELEDHQEGSELNPPKVHIESYKPDKYSSNVRSKSEKTYEKLDFRKSSLSYTGKERQEDVKPIRRVEAKMNLHSPNKISPCEIDVNCTSSIKPDILSPPLDSPKPEVPPSPKPMVRKQDYSPVQTNSSALPPSSTFSAKLENQCSTCAANIRGVGIATKLRTNCKKPTPASPNIRPSSSEGDTSPVTMHVDNGSSTVSTWTTTIASSSAPQTLPVAISGEIKVSDAKEVICPVSKCMSGKQPMDNTSSNNVFQENLSGSEKSDGQVSDLKSKFNSSSGKHITAAVIPTAPKQIVQRDHSMSSIASSSSESNTILYFEPTAVSSSSISCDTDSSKDVTIFHNIKSEQVDSAPCSEDSGKVNTAVCGVASNCCQHLHNKTGCFSKFKGIVNGAEAQPIAVKPSQNVTPKRAEESCSFKVSPDCTSKSFAATSNIPVTTCQAVLPNASLKSSDIDSSDNSVQDTFKPESSLLKGESPVDAFDCKLSQNVGPHWAKAAVSPYSWQKTGGNRDEHQAMNLTISKSNLSHEESESSIVSTSGSETTSVGSTTSSEVLKVATENTTLPGVVGVCHPNSSKISSSSSVNRFSCMPATSQPEILTELHTSSKSSIQTLRHNPTPPNTIKNSLIISNYQNRTLKSERINLKKTKIGDTEKVLPRGTLATLAPKLTKKVGFLKDGKASHTLSTSSSVSSTSIVFPASVNPCIPVGIAIAQQRQDTTTASPNVGKTQPNGHSTGSGIVAPAGHSNIITAEIPPQEIVRDQKLPQDSTGAPDSTNFLVTPGSTILSRQWESEAVTRATLPSPWVAHGSIVAPALWIGQGTYATATAPTSAAVPPTMNSMDTSPISLPPGGYQLARDSITGHLFLIPAANIVDRTSVWSSYTPPAGATLPMQQLVSQQHHTQFEQVLPQATEAEPVQDCLSLSVQHTHLSEASKELNVVDGCCLPAENALSSSVSFKPIDQHTKADGKRESAVPSVPVASGQTFTFTTFPTNCDPSSFSYVLQSSTVMHLAHTQTTSSIQTESGKRSQGTSPLHCASPSPPPVNNGTMHSTDDVCEDEDSDNDSSESISCSEVMQEVKQAQSVTTAIQVDMDTQTNSEDEEDESDMRCDSGNVKNVEMFDSANQTENDSMKCDLECDSTDTSEGTPEIIGNSVQSVIPEERSEDLNNPPEVDKSASCKPVMEIIASEAELAPSLPVESQPVMDFIDHHGLNLLVDSIEEFASRENAVGERFPDKASVSSGGISMSRGKIDFMSTEANVSNDSSVVSQPYRALDTSCTDGLGLLCALAEQRFLEESLNSDTNKIPCDSEVPKNTSDSNPSSFFAKEEESKPVFGKDRSSSESSFYEKFDDSLDMSSPAHLRACELEMRKRLADLQRKYKEKELELARLMPNIITADKTNHDIKSMNHPRRKRTLYAASKIKCRTLTSNINRSCIANNALRPSAPNFLSKQSELLKKSFLQRNRLKRLRDRRLAFLKKASGIGQRMQSNFSQESTCLKSQRAANEVPTQFESCSEEHGTGDPNSSSSSSDICGKTVKIVHPKKKGSNAKNCDSKQKNQLNNSAKVCSEKSKKGTVKTFGKVKSRERPSFSSENGNILRSSSHSEESKSKSVTDCGSSESSGNSKVPFFDEQAWFIRRSERIFLNDARAPAAPAHVTSAAGSKKSIVLQSGSSSKCDHMSNMSKEKKESHNKLHHRNWDVSKSANTSLKTEKDEVSGKVKNKPSAKLKLKHLPAKKHSHCSESSTYSRSSTSSSSDSESCGESSSQSDNLPLSILFDQASVKGAVAGEKSKRLSVDSDSSEASSALSEDIPLSILLGQNTLKGELKSCILTPAELQDKARVLILDEGLFYAGHITAVQAPDVYGIILDGERAHRPHIFSREEILNAAVLEIKPSQTSQLPEGSRICAYWSQQYRCLYPGTVAKASSPLSDSSLLYVEFDDGDSGRIPLEDIRLLPPDFPIVSLEPNPLLILGKRRARIEKENLNEQKISASQRGDGNELKYSSKLKKRRLDSAEGKPVPESKISKKELGYGTTDTVKLPSGSQNGSLDRASKVLKTDLPKASCSLQLSKSVQKEGKPSEKSKVKDAKMQNSWDSSGNEKMSSPTPLKPKKHKKHKDDHKHHHHHHHHHHRHHHKKHRNQKQSHLAKFGEKTVLSVGPATPDSSADSSLPSYPDCHSTTLCAEQKSELTVKIKTSPSPHTTHDHRVCKKVAGTDAGNVAIVTCSASRDSNLRKKSKGKKSVEENKPAKRKDRPPSVEKSKIAAFLPVRQLWRWSGKSYRRPGTKGKAKKEFYRAIQRGKELLRVGDCAVFLSTGRPHLPYIGRIETMWESWGGKMDVKVKWFYHPEETKSSKKLTQLKQGALFQSPHFDENDVQTISHKCEVLSLDEYQKKKEESSEGSTPYSALFDNNDSYYLAGTYDPITGTLTMEPGIPKIPALHSSEA